MLSNAKQPLAVLSRSFSLKRRPPTDLLLTFRKYMLKSQFEELVETNSRTGTRVELENNLIWSISEKFSPLIGELRLFNKGKISMCPNDQEICLHTFLFQLRKYAIKVLHFPRTSTKERTAHCHVYVVRGPSLQRITNIIFEV